jgi:uncharacterized protein (TIGR03086 family)
VSATRVDLTDLPPAARHAAVTDGFTRRVVGVAEGRWDAPAPVEGWVARDVVRHLVTWFPGFLEGGTGIRLPSGPSVDEDPVGAWLGQRDAVQSLLDDPASEARVLTNPHLGEVPLPQAVDRFYTGDVFLHTWDLARATGQDETLDEGMCRAMLEGMEPMDAILRSSGQYGPRVDVPPEAPVQDRLIGFIGRRP